MPKTGNYLGGPVSTSSPLLASSLAGGALGVMAGAGMRVGIAGFGTAIGIPAVAVTGPVGVLLGAAVGAVFSRR